MLNFVLLQAQSSPMSSIFLMVAIFVVFYFFMIRPQQTKAKKQQAYREGLKKGDKVVTIGGVHGKITAINDDNTLTIEIDTAVKVKVEKSAISMESSEKISE